ncbi:putative 3-oxoacyl-synthase [Nemania sp. FL0916]|nr:putative 3-oxoacyl-synthase [Nemania sp. FL0916]
MAILEDMGQEQEQRELAHLLLTELLAYQFAMPVRWTETQTVLFDRFKARKLVEVGPSSTLINMAKKTLSQFNVASDAVNGIERLLLAVNSHYEDLCYTSVPSNDESQDSPGANEPVQTAPLSSEQRDQVPVVPLQTVPISSKNEPIPDAPISALDSITALVASSLRKSNSAINLSESLKGLSGGRSTIQNEIVGDLLQEFGQVPDNVENMPLKDLASAIQTTYDGKPGKCLRSRIDKMMAAKMPASFGMAATRSYLCDAWGLGSGRQDAVLLLALSQQPSQRFKDSREAEAFLDGIAQSHLDSAGLTRQIARATGQSAEETLVDSKVLSQLRSEQDALRAKIAALLRPEQNNAAPESTDHESTLSLYERELGEEFCNGIKPIFQAGHQRSYESAWNWAHVELLSAYYRCVEAQSSGREPSPHDLSAIERLLGDKSNPRLNKVRSFLMQREESNEHGTTTKIGEVFVSARNDSELDEITSSDDSINDDSYDDLDDLDEDTTLQNLNTGPSNDPFAWQITNSTHVVSQAEKESGPLLRVLRRRGPSWVSHERLTKFVNIDTQLLPGEFAGKYVLMTGTGPNSIGIAILPKLLRSGAKVVLGTSRNMSDAGPFYQKVFATYGVPGSKLVVLPSNQGSSQDVHDLISHIYDPINGLGWDLDVVLPLAAVSEKGREMDELDSRSELAHRAMLVNLLRGLGAIKKAKAARGIRTRPTQVLLPLSPNMGTFGSDGLYSESKVGLMATLYRWTSESWSEYLSICGVVIGWTRGTGLMEANDGLVQWIEKLGVTTFSINEMAGHMCKLLTEPFVSFCQTEPFIADFSGGMSSNPDMAASLAEVRFKTGREREIERALADEQVLDRAAVEVNHVSSAPGSSASQSLPPLVDLGLDFPTLPDYGREVQPLNQALAGMVDLESVVVVVGFSELGPWGNSRTRWEMELKGELSPRACIELAWMTGMIKANKSSGPSAAEWVDSLTGSPVKDSEVRAKYEKRILESTGLRLIHPSPLDHPSRDKKRFLQEVVVQEDLAPFTASYETAMDFVREHGNEKVQIRQTAPGADEYSVHIRKGAVIMVPKASVYDRVVGGQIPTGWDPRVYGLPEDICESVDRCTLMALVCAAEAFQSAGITDVYELFQTMHVSDLANCVGSGMGGGQSLQKLYRERLLEKPVQSDILAETFINTTSAWLNMLLMGASGPTRTPVGACATALESLNQGYDLITSGAAKVCLVGGFDDMTQDTSAEFANMKATNNSAADLKEHGRAPHETCRPCTTSRAGFVESEGCGMQVLTSAKTALELGLPIHAVVAHVSTSSDGIGRSVPAPGQGLMTQVRESSAAPSSPLLNIAYRKSMLDLTLRHIRERYNMLHPGTSPLQQSKDEAVVYADEIERAQRREENEARRRFGNDFWKGDVRIAPLRGALAVWGLTADDVGVVSLHGTSTQANEKNEVAVLHQQLSQLGRSPGNAALVVCQKYLTGHPKGAAAAWMVNGCCQILDSGIVPGNRNADDIDAVLEPYDNLVFPDRALAVGDVRAFSVTSFGFGQKGAQALGVHPKFLFATLENRSVFDEYCRRRDERCQKATQYFQDGIYMSRLVELKQDPPYVKEHQVKAMVNADWRLI